MVHVGSHADVGSRPLLCRAETLVTPLFRHLGMLHERDRHLVDSITDHVVGPRTSKINEGQGCFHYCQSDIVLQRLLQGKLPEEIVYNVVIFHATTWVK
jgi:hypothetical protein